MKENCKTSAREWCWSFFMNIGQLHGNHPSQKLYTVSIISHSAPTRYRIYLFIFYLFGVLRRFQHCTGHITTGSWNGRGNQYIQFVRVLYCKLPTNGKQLPAFTLEGMSGIEPRPQRWEARVLPLCNRAPPPPNMLL